MAETLFGLKGIKAVAEKSYADVEMDILEKK